MEIERGNKAEENDTISELMIRVQFKSTIFKYFFNMQSRILLLNAHKCKILL